MQASVGVSAGPVRVSQGIGCAALVTVIPVVALLGGVGWILGFSNEVETQLPDGHYVAKQSAPEGWKIEPGTYRTTVPKAADDTCTWWISDGSGNKLNQGEPKPGSVATVTIGRGRYFNTFDCGTWVKVA